MPVSRTVRIVPPLDIPQTRAIPLGGAGKRIFDIVFSSVALLSFLLPFLAIAIAIRVITRDRVFYVHWRVGHGGKLIPCLKFRTMVPDAERKLQELLADDPALREEYAQTRKLRRDPRVIPGIGRFLRVTSLDELPQFLNVLAGHMSVVGPRPMTKDEFAFYCGTVHRYLDARPGITGLWQVSGRNEKSFQERVEFDSRYIETWSFWLDLKIIVKTLSVLGKGA